VILLPRAVRVYFATAPTNLRKSFEGLSNDVRALLAQDPLSGHLFVFLNRRRNQVKLWRPDLDPHASAPFSASAPAVAAVAQPGR
jgi:hypothetical protein